MKVIIGFLLVLSGIVSGLWCGIWWAFIGGIVDVIREVRSPELDAMNIAIGIAKVFFSGVIGWLSAVVMLLPGVALIKSA